MAVKWLRMPPGAKEREREGAERERGVRKRVQEGKILPERSREEDCMGRFTLGAGDLEETPEPEAAEPGERRGREKGRCCL